MLGFYLGALAVAASAQTASPSVGPGKCLSVAIPNRDGSMSSFVSFAVTGSSEQLAAVRAAAFAIGATAEPPKRIDGGLILFVFFNSDMKSQDAINLYNRVGEQAFHPGVARDSFMLKPMILPIETRKNCPK